MPNPTYTNQLQLEEVTLGLEHVLWASYGGGDAWATSPVKVTVDAPPANFSHLGAVADDSPQITCAKDMYALDTGIPQMRQYQAVQRIAADFQVVFHSHTNIAAYFGIGGIAPQSATTNAKSMSAATRLACTVNTTGFAVGDMIVTAASTLGLAGSLNYGWVTTINTTQVLLSGTGFPITPGTTDYIAKVLYSQLAAGTHIVPTFCLMGVADFYDGGQVVHLMRRAQPRGQWAEALRAGQDIRIAAAFDLLGYIVSTPYSSTGEIATWERFWFPPTTIQ